MDGQDNFEIKPSPIHGHGCFTLRDFKAGEPIGHAAIVRDKDGLEGSDAVIERTPLGRYVNHAHQPNSKLAELQPGHLHLVAITDLPAGSELTCHYAHAIVEQLRAYRSKNAPAIRL